MWWCFPRFFCLSKETVGEVARDRTRAALANTGWCFARFFGLSEETLEEVRDDCTRGPFVDAVNPNKKTKLSSKVTTGEPGASLSNESSDRSSRFCYCRGITVLSRCQQDRTHIHNSSSLCTVVFFAVAGIRWREGFAVGPPPERRQ